MPTAKISQNRHMFKMLKKATGLPNPYNTLEEFKEVMDPGQDLIGADRLELRRAWNAVELALLLADGDRVLYMDTAGNMITARAYLLRRLAAIKRLWKGAA